MDGAWRKPSRHGPVEGKTVVWHDDEGWGAVGSPEVDGEVWVHFSVIDLPSDVYRSLSAGQAVTFTYETPGQDGYPHRARRVIPH